MTREELESAFEAAADAPYTGAYEVSGRFGTKRTDLHAFLLLDSLLPGKTGDMVCAAEHDEIWLDVDLDELAAVITVEQIEELDSCGVRIDDYGDGLSMHA